MSICFVVVLINAIVTIVGLRSLSSIPERLSHHQFSVGLALREIEVDVMVVQQSLSALAQTPSPLRLRRFKVDSLEAEDRVRANLALVRERFEGDPSLVAGAIEDFDAWLPLRGQVVEAVEAGDPIAAYTLAKTDGARQIKLFTERLTALATAATAQSAAEIQRSLDIGDRVAWFETVVIAISLFLTACCLWFVHANLMRPVGEIGAALTDIASGNLKRDIPHVGREDEIGAVARSAQVFLAQAVAIRNSSFDALTGLPTRRQLAQNLAERVAEIGADAEVTALFLDIDRFTEVNEAHGREVGDEILREVARRIQLAAGPQDIIARDGSDSFIVLTSAGEEHAIMLAERLQENLAVGIETSAAQHLLSCSIGIAAGTSGDAPQAVVLHADDALQEARKTAPGTVTVYTSEMDERLRRRRDMRKGLDFALDHGEIVPFFQPQIFADTGKVAGFEALVRWNHPEHGLLVPWQFLPLAEGAGLLPRITETMVNGSLEQLATWRRVGLEVPRMSLNFDASDLRRESFVDTLMLTVERFDLAPADVCVELLESAMIEDATDPIMRTLERLAELGFHIELDDFGTGHAAISSLSLINLNAIKIDRGFIKNIVTQPSQRNLTKAMLRLASAMRIGSIAEGVETEETRRLLCEMGCEKLQGFGIGRPMSASDATQWLESYAPSENRVFDFRASA